MITTAAGYSSAAVTTGHLAFKRAIRHAEANDLISRNVTTLADAPKASPAPKPFLAGPDGGIEKGQDIRTERWPDSRWSGPDDRPGDVVSFHRASIVG
jgi:hypothetical protein